MPTTPSLFHVETNVNCGLNNSEKQSCLLKLTLIPNQDKEKKKLCSFGYNAGPVTTSLTRE